ncbi:MAG: beta-glucosidase [Ideonella sp. WA131b]|jgi:beta-glucosidase|nr:beta-glucosidase [Ideonella sp. WA131b]
MNPPPVLHPSHPFVSDFVWGVATSSFQIEGAAQADGKGESIWDRFCRQVGAIADGSSGDVACDHYHRLESDLGLIAGLGVDAYRFSVSWPRVQPDGQGAFNEAGLAFYERLVDGLLARGIKPYLTLNHWDLPQALQERGGWADRDTVHRFVVYARHLAERLGDRVVAITTHNEPWVMAVLGHESGIFAPGIRHRGTAMQVAHHLLLSHGLALRALRADGCRARLGIVLNLSPIGPATDSPEDRAAARLEDGRSVRWYMDPLFRGEYPADVWQHLGGDVPAVHDGDLAVIATPMDFLGINYYTRGVVSASGAWSAQHSGKPLTDMGWEIVPEGLTELLLRLHRDWTVPPLYVMENGAAFQDTLTATPEGPRVHDADRRDYIARHIAAVGDAAAQGVPMAGFMVWSLMDNFEWASGYAKRFGIVHVDYATLARTPKDSYLWYRDFLRQQHARRHCEPEALAAVA